MISKLLPRKGIHFNKNYMNISELTQMVEERNGPNVRSERSYELEAMNVKMKDLKLFSKEDVEELRIIHKDNILYKIYFSWFWDHLPKAISLVLSLMLFTYWFGVEGLVAFIPIGLLMTIFLIFIRMTRGY